MREMKLTVSMIGLVALIACDCEVYSIGLVVDAETMEPLDSVNVYRDYDGPGFNFSDSTGLYIYDSYKGGARCNDFELIFARNGYVTETITVNNSTVDTIEITLERS